MENGHVTEALKSCDLHPADSGLEVDVALDCIRLECLGKLQNSRRLLSLVEEVRWRKGGRGEGRKRGGRGEEGREGGRGEGEEGERGREGVGEGREIGCAGIEFFVVNYG